MKKMWPQVKLDEILTPVSRAESVGPTKTYYILGAHWYAKGLYTKDILTGAEIQAPRVYRVEKGDFVYNRLFAWKGSFALASDENDGCYVSNEFPCFSVNVNRLEGKYLWLYCSRQSIWNEALGLSTGGTPTSRNRLKEEQLLAMQISLPPLEEQRRIVARIEELSAIIEEARNLRQDAAAGVRALLQAARRNLIGETPGKRWIPLSTYVQEIENGWSPACENHPAQKGEWGVVKVGAVSFGIFEPEENKALPISLSPHPHCEIRAGDFLMSRANTTELVGACALVDRTPRYLMLSDKIFRFIFKKGPNIHLGYLNHVLKSPALRSQIEQAATGTSPTMKNISKEKTMRLLIPQFDLADQRRIVAHLDELQSKVDAVKKHQNDSEAELDALMPSILSCALAGGL
jgi:type I restriction enzyme S subunit